MIQSEIDPSHMREEEDEEIALLYGNGNPQEDSSELPQLRSRKDYPRTGSREIQDGCVETRVRRLKCQRRPDMHCLAVTLLGMTIVSLAVAVVWYSYELFNHGYVCMDH